MVRVSLANSFKRVCRPFLRGKNPSKVNLSTGNPAQTKAGTKAVAPGKQITFRLYLITSLTK